MTQGRLRSQAGMTLIEVLVSILILSFGIIGLVGLQARATQISMDSEDRTRAALLANEIISSMWGNGTTTVSSAALTAWNTRVADTSNTGLPNGVGTVSAPDANNVVTVTITWQAPNKTASNQYITQVAM